MRATIAAAVAAGGMFIAAGRSANAGGFEYPENGSLAMGRGGAFVVRASDPTAIIHNTAGIVGLDGLQITVSSNIALESNCFQRTAADGSRGFYLGSDQNVSVSAAGTVFDTADGQGTPTYANGTRVYYPRVCSDQAPFLAPQILATYRVNDWFAIGLGLYGPNSVGEQSFPITVGGVNAMGQPIDAMGHVVAAGSHQIQVPTPIRYQFLNEKLLIIHPTLSLAVAPMRGLRFGVALQPSFAQFQFTTMANASGEQSPATDIQTSVSASGFFFAFNLGAQFILPRYFSAGIHVHYNPEHVSLSGTGHALVGPYATHPMEGQNQFSSDFHVDRMVVGLPWSTKFGLRFALPRSNALHPQDSPRYDPMRDDIFDLEINWMYEHSSAFDALTLQNSGSIRINSSTLAPAPAMITVPHNWHDVWGLRLGGDVNLVPNHLAARIGVSYEMGAQSPYYGQIDVASHTTTGLHVGLSVRLAFLTISAAYAHFFMTDFTVVQSNPAGSNISTLGTTGPVSEHQCMTGAGADTCANNVGVYSSGLDVFNFGLSAHF